MTTPHDPLAGSAWSRPATVQGFVDSPPNERLLDTARHYIAGAPAPRLVDIGCGAGRNAVPLARQGWTVTGTDLSRPMLEAASARAREGVGPGRLDLVLAPMEVLPLAARSADFVVAHGIWNLATTTAEFRRAVREAARVARPGAALFVFTFSRHTLPADAPPVPGEAFVYTQFSGAPQVFLTAQELIDELAAAGFTPDPLVALRELNRPASVALKAGGPVIYEGGFLRA